MRRLIDRHRAPGIVFAAVAFLAAAPAVLADDTSGQPPGFWDRVLQKLDLKTRPAPMPDFVQATHPAPSTMTFIPTGPSPRNQKVRVKSSDEIEATKADLDAAQAAQLPPDPAPPTAPAPAPPPKRKAKPAKSAAAKVKPVPQAD